MRVYIPNAKDMFICFSLFSTRLLSMTTRVSSLCAMCNTYTYSTHTQTHSHTYHDNGERFDKAVKKALVFRSIYRDIGCAKEYACMSL